MTDLSVIIVNYNVKHYLAQCLHSVFAASQGLDIEVFVVDNHSTDGSLAYLEPRFPAVRFIANAENLGFSRANNQAIRQATGRYVLLLNPDTLVTENALTDCIAYLDRHPEVGATGTAMYGSTGRFAWESRRGVPTPWVAFCKMAGLTSLFPHSRRFGRYYMRYLNREKANYIEIISGAFFMLRREALQQVGLLDETFFMYGEDIDLSYRLLQAGWRNAYVPAPILHYKGESTQKTTYRYVHSFYEAMLIFFDKHFRRRYRLLAILIRIAVYLRAATDGAGRLWQRAVAPLRRLCSRPAKPGHALCIASQAAQPAMRDICCRHGIQATFLTAEGLTSHDAIPCNHDFNYLICDTSVLRYEQMLTLLISAAGRKHPYILGTYSPQTNTIILPYDICQ